MSKIHSVNELEYCPFCGNDEYYQRMYVSGSTECHSRFDGSDGADNSEMYSGLDHTMGAKIYCNNCNKYLGNLNTGKLSVEAQRCIDSSTFATKPSKNIYDRISGGKI